MDKDKLIYLAVGVALGMYVVPRIQAKITGK